MIKHTGIERNKQSYGSIHLRQPYLIHQIIYSIPGLSDANKKPNPTTNPLLTKDEEGLPRKKKFHYRVVTALDEKK